jgi:hypothetical protein
MAENGDDGEPKGIPLNVPFEHNDEVKILGGRWPMWDVDLNDPEKKKMKKTWYTWKEQSLSHSGDGCETVPSSSMCHIRRRTRPSSWERDGMVSRSSGLSPLQ